MWKSVVNLIKRPLPRYRLQDNQQGSSEEIRNPSETTRRTPFVRKDDDIVHRNSWMKEHGKFYNALFATHCFSFNENELLTNVFKINFGLDVRVAKCRMRNVLRYRLYVTSRSMDRFIALITPYIHPCFQYRIRKLSMVASSSGNTETPSVIRNHWV